MKLRLSECDYDFLRPPKDVFNVTHSEHYVRHGEGKKAVRKIFEDVQFTKEELEKLKEFDALIAQENIPLPPNWSQFDNVKMMYAGKFDFKKSLKVMREHAEWRASPARGVLGTKAYKLLEDGILQISGRDKQYRPIIILNVYRIDPKAIEADVLIEALSFVLDVCINFYFVPGKVENWVFIIETNGVGLTSFPFKVIETINKSTSVNYTSRLDKLYIMNPSSLFSVGWKVVHGFLDPETASKIFVYKKSEFGKLLESIAPNQLDQRYGGTLATPTTFWPPLNTLNQAPYTSEKKNVGQFEESKIDTRENLVSKEAGVDKKATGNQSVSEGQSFSLSQDQSQTGGKALLGNEAKQKV